MMKNDILLAGLIDQSRRLRQEMLNVGKADPVSDMQRRIRDAKITQAHDTDSCYDCGLPIKSGDAVYTITHSHYECYERRVRK